MNSLPGIECHAWMSSVIIMNATSEATAEIILSPLFFLTSHPESIAFSHSFQAGAVDFPHYLCFSAYVKIQLGLINLPSCGTPEW